MTYNQHHAGRSDNPALGAAGSGGPDVPRLLFDVWDVMKALDVDRNSAYAHMRAAGGFMLRNRWRVLPADLEAYVEGRKRGATPAA